MYLYKSTFANIKRGITLNACILSEIAHNDFNVQHSGGYGVYLLSSGGSTVAHNRFFSHLPMPAGETPPHWAAVINNAGGTFNSYLYNNYFTFAVVPPFDGQFYAATQVETPGTGLNRFVYVDCNEYASLNRYDLFIDNTTPTFINQGGCESADDAINPTANLWHSIIGTAPQHHIYYANNDAGFQITCLPGHLPTEVSSNVNVDECNIDENICDSFSDIGGDYSQRVAEIRGRLLDPDLDERTQDALFAELLRTHLKESDYEAAKTELINRDFIGDRRILVATYTDERELEAAIAELARIPLNEQPDIDFYNLFMALIEDLIANPTPEDDDGNGKTAILLPEVIGEEALKESKSTTSILAQSVVAKRQGFDYWRTPNYENNKTRAVAAEQGNITLQIVPNPAQETVQISADVLYATHLVVYDYMGNLIQKAPLYNGARKQWNIITYSLANGIYICHLLNGTQRVAVGKLAIIK